MSPLHLRRYRAERLLRAEFDALRGSVLGAVRARLRDRGSSLDDADLEACYSMAWQGLYAAVLDGEEVHNPAGWLVLVTYRRAIDEQRVRHPQTELPSDAAAASDDLAAAMDDRIKLRQLVEGMGVRLNERERQAAALCYLQGLSREEAASQMGIGIRRLQKLMEGRPSSGPGVASKMRALTESITGGRFCEEHASLMRALAFGVLDPEGERHQIALAHCQTCPACRAHVRFLRGLSAVLPPVFVPGLLRGAGLGGGARMGARPGGIRHAVAKRIGGMTKGLGRVGSRLGGIGSRLAGGGASGAKLAAVGVVLLGAGGAGVAVSASSSGAHAHHRDRGSSIDGGVAPATGHSERRSASARAARHHGHPKGRRQASQPLGGAQKRLARTPRRPHPSVSPAQHEFGIERDRSAQPQTSPASKAQREFGPK